MIAFMFIFNIFFCSIFSFPPMWFVKCAVGRGFRGRSAGGMGCLSARGHEVGIQGAQVVGVQGPRWREYRGPRWLEVCKGPVSRSTGGPRGCSAGGLGGI